MAGRPTSTPASTSTLRVEILKELQSLLDDREVRDRLDRGPLGETKGKEHWVLHLLLRGQESLQAHVDVLIGTAYSNLLARLGAIEERVARMESGAQAQDAELKRRFDGVEATLVERVSREIGTGFDTASAKLGDRLTAALDEKWRPVGESIESFSHASGQLTKDLSDTYRVATQSRLLLNENARRMIDLGRDIVALEESLKLALGKVLEDGLAPLEERISALEARLPANGDLATETNGRTEGSGGA